jgi:hypothetical protein
MKKLQIIASQYDTFLKGPRAGQPKTEKDRVLRYIIEGLKRAEYASSSRKYRIFVGILEDSYLYVGQKGSVRSGKSITESHSCTDRIHIAMEKWEASR